ncbi:hypothetical protein LXA43DRAFT_314595 [Ganoderma leucocontextum]|nr:hypothetical protein LXA43DRAFT_314595 [Ganoderma leucocontextum]
MDPLTREETLRILSVMGVQIPKNTKLSCDVLDKHLKNALNAAQNRDQLPISAPLDPETAQKWPVRHHPAERESMKRAIWRGSEEEAQKIMPLRAIGEGMPGRAITGEGMWPWYSDPFWGLRQTMVILGHTIDEGYHWVTIQAPNHKYFAITIRLLHTLQVDVGTPGIVVVYRAFNPITQLDAVSRQTAVFRSLLDCGQPRVCIRASPLELKLVLKLLAVNAKLLSPHYQPPARLFEQQLVSVLLPIAPLGFREIDRLGNDPGCVVCGNERKARCSQCQSVSYCSVACQKADWPAHKQTCLSLKGGKWWTIPFRVCPPGEGGLAKARSGLLDMFHRQRWTDPDRLWLKEDDPPPPNIHGVKTFLVKFQAPLVAWAHPAFLMYDRQHSFDNVFFYAEDSPEVYAALMQEVQGPRSGHEGTNMYRWARRTDKRELKVCLDREPTSEW